MGVIIEGKRRRSSWTKCFILKQHGNAKKRSKDLEITTTWEN